MLGTLPIDSTRLRDLLACEIRTSMLVTCLPGKLSVRLVITLRMIRSVCSSTLACAEAGRKAACDRDHRSDQQCSSYHWKTGQDRVPGELLDFTFLGLLTESQIELDLCPHDHSPDV